MWESKIFTGTTEEEIEKKICEYFKANVDKIEEAPIITNLSCKYDRATCKFGYAIMITCKIMLYAS